MMSNLPIFVYGAGTISFMRMAKLQNLPWTRQCRLFHSYSRHKESTSLFAHWNGLPKSQVGPSCSSYAKNLNFRRMQLRCENTLAVLQDAGVAGPDSDLEWWKLQLAKLSHIKSQLKSNDARATVGIVHASRSKTSKRWHELEFKVSSITRIRSVISAYRLSDMNEGHAWYTYLEGDNHQFWTAWIAQGLQLVWGKMGTVQSRKNGDCIHR